MTIQLARGGGEVQNIIGLLVGLIVIIVLVYLLMNLL
jgi:hypothetical protein